MAMHDLRNNRFRSIKDFFLRSICCTVYLDTESVNARVIVGPTPTVRSIFC